VTSSVKGSGIGERERERDKIRKKILYIHNCKHLFSRTGNSTSNSFDSQIQRSAVSGRNLRERAFPSLLHSFSCLFRPVRPFCGAVMRSRPVSAQRDARLSFFFPSLSFFPSLFFLPNSCAIVNNRTEGGGRRHFSLSGNAWSE